MDEIIYIAIEWRILFFFCSEKFRMFGMKEMKLYMCTYKVKLSPPVPPPVRMNRTNQHSCTASSARRWIYRYINVIPMKNKKKLFERENKKKTDSRAHSLKMMDKNFLFVWSFFYYFSIQHRCLCSTLVIIGVCAFCVCVFFVVCILERRQLLIAFNMNFS